MSFVQLIGEDVSVPIRWKHNNESFIVAIDYDNGSCTLGVVMFIFAVDIE